MGHQSKLREPALILHLAALLLITAASTAQAIPKIDETAARANLLTHADPVYPPIAKAAQVAGPVVLDVKINAKVVVEHVTVVSGSSMLQRAAIDAVRQWTFKPVIADGLAESVSTTITVPFGDDKAFNANDLVIAKEYFALEDKCHALVGARANTAEQTAACSAAAQKAEEFSSNTRFIERRSAFVFAATALLRDKQFGPALEYADKAVAVVRQGHDDGSGSSAAYAIKGQAEAFNDKLPEADQDLAQAEHFQREAMSSAAGHDLPAIYSQSLKGLLTFRAQVLDALGKVEEARKMSDEADAL